MTIEPKTRNFQLINPDNLAYRGYPGKKAKELGLDYFGPKEPGGVIRYGKNNKVTHIVGEGVLIPIEKLTAKWRKSLATTMELYDPLFNTERPALVTTAAVSNPNNPPKSPLSGQPMQVALAGNYGQKPFKVWVHLADRIVLPYRESS